MSAKESDLGVVVHSLLEILAKKRSTQCLVLLGKVFKFQSIGNGLIHIGNVTVVTHLEKST